jgi:hypothetical protein
MERIEYNGTLIGLLVTSFEEGSRPITDGSEPLQVVTLKHPSGAYLKAHTHIPKHRETETLQECLIVKKGCVELNLYGPDAVFYRKLTLNGGDMYISMRGGFAVHILEDAEVIEVKNGPFIEDKQLIGPDA